MTDINGKTLYCRDAEEKVLNAFISGKKSDRKLSIRDHVVVRMDNSAYYRLWNTELVRRYAEGIIWIYIASNMEERDRYWQPNGFSTWQPREYAISNTTKSRLNAFLSYYGFNSLEVHSSKKLFGVWHNGKELDRDSWYELDFTSHELVKVN